MAFKDVKIHYCRYMEDWSKYSEKINKCNYVGFDVEFVKEKAALIQISTMTDAYILHIFHWKELPKSLKEFLENENKIKIGVGVKNDLKNIIQNLKGICKIFIFYYAEF